MERIRFLFKNYKFRSIVIRNFCILISLSLLSAVMFYYFTQNLFYEQYKQNVRDSQMATLSSNAAFFDAQLTNVAQSMQMAMKYEDIIRVSLNPDRANYTHTKNITAYLNNVLVENTPLVRQAYYYVWSTGDVYTSMDAVLSLEDFGYRYLLDIVHEANPDVSVFSAGSTRTLLYTAGETNCLVQDFPLEQRLGTMICILDMQQLYDAFFHSQTAGTTELFAFTEAGRAAFSVRQEYPTLRLELPLEDDEVITLSDVDYHVVQGSLIPWYYLYKINPHVTVDYQALLKYFLPFLALFLLIGLASAIFTTMHLYLPVNQLMKSVRPAEGTMAQHRNEFEFLQHSYQKIVSQVGQYSETIQAVTPAVLRNLFNNLIMGREGDGTAVEETLASLNYPFRAEDRYLVLLTRVLKLSTARLPETESSFCQLRLTQLLKETVREREGISTYLFSDYRGDFVTILSMADTAPHQDIQETVLMLRSAFLEQGNQWPYQMLVTAGPECPSISGLGASYSEALQAIRAEQYRITDAETAEEQEIEESSFGLDDIEYEFFRQQLRQIHAYLDEEALDVAREALSSLINQVRETVVVVDISHYYQFLIDSLLERTIPLALSEESKQVLDQEIIRDRLTNSSLDSVVQFVKDYCAQLLGLLQTGTSKKQNRYIATAKEYIAQNYADSSLSMNSTSEYVGIHVSYLGRLFREHLDQHFTNYLNEYRIGIAMQLLKATNHSVTEIGFKTGFNSAQSFIRVFKKHTGMTPGQYREKKL